MYIYKCWWWRSYPKGCEFPWDLTLLTQSAIWPGHRAGVPFSPLSLHAGAAVSATSPNDEPSAPRRRRLWIRVLSRQQEHERQWSQFQFNERSKLKVELEESKPIRRNCGQALCRWHSCSTLHEKSRPPERQANRADSLNPRLQRSQENPGRQSSCLRRCPVSWVWHFLQHQPVQVGEATNCEDSRSKEERGRLHS